VSHTRWLRLYTTPDCFDFRVNLLAAFKTVSTKMDSLSGRPPTPAASSAAASPPQASGKKINERLRSYTPTLFDILNISDLIKNSKGSNSSHIPSTFLETASVDSAKQIGSGASFRASLRAIPEGTEEIKIRPIDIGGWTVTTTLPAPDRPKYVVFKVAKVAFDKQGNPHQDHTTSLQSVLTEFHALLHPSLFKHPNVVDLLDIAWGSNPFNHDQRLPSLVLEYADQGTLLDAVRRGDMSSTEKRVLCHDTAAGLQALHDVGLIHGDVKADNVLLFSGKDRRVAKLADFGFSLVEGFESDTIWLGGTRPWQAPEVQRAVPITEAKHTDTYSFGLLVWYLTLDGRDPFKRFCVSDRPIEEWDQEMANFKARDGLRYASKTTVWLPLHLEKIMLEGKATANHKFNRVLSAISGKAPDRLASLLKQASALIIHGDEILQIIDRVFEHSLVSEPKKRSLPAIIDILQPVTTSIPLSELTLRASSTSIGDEEGTNRGSDPAEKENAKDARVDEVPNGRNASHQSWEQRGFKVALINLLMATKPLTAYRKRFSHGTSSARFPQHCIAPYTKLCQKQRETLMMLTNYSFSAHAWSTATGALLTSSMRSRCYAGQPNSAASRLV
jgi:serine/threonine protein kinase